MSDSSNCCDWNLKEKIEKAKAELNELYDETKEKAVNFYHQSNDILKEQIKLIDDRVHNNPWPVILGSFAVGVLIGWILGRK